MGRKTLRRRDDGIPHRRREVYSHERSGGGVGEGRKKGSLTRPDSLTQTGVFAGALTHVSPGQHVYVRTTYAREAWSKILV